MSLSANDQRSSHVFEPTRGLTPARIVALALIALVVLALAYPRFAPDTSPESISMPQAAKQAT